MSGTASGVVSGWPDEATVERVAEAMSVAEDQWFNAPTPSGDPGDTSDYFPTLARAALLVLPDPTADTVLLDKVREFCDGEARSMIATLNASEGGAKWAAGAADAHNAVLTFIAALLAGGGE